MNQYTLYFSGPHGERLAGNAPAQRRALLEIAQLRAHGFDAMANELEERVKRARREEVLARRLRLQAVRENFWQHDTARQDISLRDTQ